MRIRALIALLFITGILNRAVSQSPDSIVIGAAVNYEKIDADLDSLVASWYVKMAMANNPQFFSDDTAGIVYPDSVYESRLSKINSHNKTSL